VGALTFIPILDVTLQSPCVWGRWGTAPLRDLVPQRRL
jgi:hypothetical protein